MADFNTTRESGKKKKGGADDILATARADWSRAYDYEEQNIKEAYDDLDFFAGNQWPSEQRRSRDAEGRPVLTDNRLPQFVQQITGDIRQMQPAIKVIPVDNDADEKKAKVIQDLIRYIENRSDAQGVYFQAADSQVVCGIGHLRVTSEYADDSTFNQELRIESVDDGVAVLWDPDAKRPERDDAKYCFVPVDMTRAAFEAQWPGVQPSEFGDVEWKHNKDWVTDDYIRVCEYWVKKPARKTLAMMPDGSVHDVTDADSSVLAFHKAQGARVDERDSYKICRYLITASDVLEGPVEWKGRFIPIVPVVGREIRIGRKLIRKGLVRDAKDPQRMVNYFHSAHTETVALQPKAPYMVTEANVAKYQGLWEQANVKNLPYLIYEPDSKNGGAAPARIAPAVSSAGVVDGLNLAVESLKSVTGIYDASLGARSNETSGKAIMARQREGDVGSYVYLDAFARAVRQTGKILVDLLPHYYDNERTIRIVGEDGRVDVVSINKAIGVDPATGQTQYENDLTIGSYDVVTTVGPSYTTKRQEAKEGMVAFLQAAPAAAPLVLDLVAKSQDWPMADDFAKRLRAGLPPAILAMEDAEKQGADPEEARKMAMAQAQPPPDPKVVEAQARIEMEDQRFQFEQASRAQDAEREQAKMLIEQQNAEAQRQIEIAKLQESARQADAKLQAEIMLERERIASQERIAMRKAEIDAEAKERDATMRAAVAKYQTDNRPQPAAQ